MQNSTASAKKAPPLGPGMRRAESAAPAGTVEGLDIRSRDLAGDRLEVDPSGYTRNPSTWRDAARPSTPLATSEGQRLSSRPSRSRRIPRPAPVRLGHNL